MVEITVLRLNHRPARDKRLTSHLALAARALGAQRLVYSGIKDKTLETSISKIVENWGGSFKILFSDNYKKTIRAWDGPKIHLTMYGLPFQEEMADIQKSIKDVLLIVGGPKVPGETFGLVDLNLSVTNQPHSEVSAMAIFLHEFFNGEELDIRYRNSKIKIIPSVNHKKVMRGE
jgi:tRNA (cytidine56-2'-O)-methyltransferase